MSIEKLKAFTAAIEAQHEDARRVRASIALLRSRNDALVKEGADLTLKARTVQSLLPKLPTWADDAVDPAAGKDGMSAAFDGKPDEVHASDYIPDWKAVES